MLCLGEIEFEETEGVPQPEEEGDTLNTTLTSEFDDYIQTVVKNPSVLTDCKDLLGFETNELMLALQQRRMNCKVHGQYTFIETKNKTKKLIY